MNEAERERTMNFILEQQAHFAAGMEKFEVGMQRLRRDLVLMAVQFRRERKDLRERISALVDSHIRAGDRLTRLEELTERNSEAINRNSEAISRNSEAIRRNSEDIRRNSEDIRALTNYVARDGGKQNGDTGEG